MWKNTLVEDELYKISVKEIQKRQNKFVGFWKKKNCKK